MKKILLFAAFIAIIYFVFKDCHRDLGTPITGYKGVVTSADGNVITLQGGLRVKLIGVDNRTDVQMFINNNYIDKEVTLYADSKLEQDFMSADEIVRAYAVLDNGWSINHLVVNEYPDAYSEQEMTDSIPFVIEKPDPTVKADLALYMKQRTFLVMTQEGLGTGFFINENGLAITNWHVLKPGDQAMAVLYQNDPDDSKIYSDKKRNIKNILKSSPLPNGLDITIFSVELENGEKVPYFDLAKRHTQQGSSCATYGNPMGFTASFSRGDVGAYRLDEWPGNENQGILDSEHPRHNVMLMQYNMTTNGGNSGGPVCDIYGQIIAVHELGLKTGFDGRPVQGLNFGIDILQVRDMLDALEGIKYGGKY